MSRQSSHTIAFRIQLAGWTCLYFTWLLFQFPLPQNTIAESFVKTTIAIGSFMLILYGNTLVLIPLFYEKNRKLLYVLLLIVFAIAVTTFRVWINHAILSRFFYEVQYDFSSLQWGYMGFSTIMILFISILFYSFIKYYRLVRNQEKLEAARLKAELDLLKAQVQPHFLFNTLNNIYYECREESPKSAHLIEKLSEIMRYFVDECPQEMLPVSKEVTLLNNYIDLEKIRMRYPLQLGFEQYGNMSVNIPPMLLMPFVENLFKHGIDKRIQNNEASIQLSVTNKQLRFSVSNKLPANKNERQSGIGLQNLEKRLQLLFNTNYTLNTALSNGYYTATLIIPVQ